MGISGHETAVVVYVDTDESRSEEIGACLEQDAYELVTASDIDSVPAIAPTVVIVEAVDVETAVARYPDADCIAIVEPGTATDALDAGAADIVEFPNPTVVRNRVRRTIDAATREAAHETLTSRYQALFDDPSAFAAILAPDGTLRDVNAPAVALVDADREALLGGRLWEQPWFAHDAAVRETIQTHVERAADGQHVQFETTFRTTRDPEPGVVDISMTPVRDADGTITEIVAGGQDVTDRSRAMARIDQSRAFLESLTEISTDPVDDHEIRIRRLLALGRERLGVDQGIVAAIDDHDNTWNVVTADGDGPVPDDATVVLEETICQHALEQDDRLIVPDIAETDLATGGPLADVASYIGGRIDVNDSLYGTVCFVDGESRRGAYDDATLAMLDLLIDHVRDELEHRVRIQRLERYQRLVENVEDMMYILDPEGTFEMVTEPLASFLGYDRETLVGKTTADVLTPESLDRSQATFQQFHAGQTTEAVSKELVAVTAADTELPVAVETTPIFQNDTFIGAVGAARDIRELTEKRRRLDIESNRFSYLFRHLPDPVVEVEFTEAGPRLVSANPAFEDTFGVDSETDRGRLLNRLIVPEDRTAAAAALDSEAAAGEQTQAEIRRETVDGERDFLFRGVPYEREQTRYGFGIYTDITDRQRRQRQLDVIQRVLRHNLRNDMNIVLGRAENVRQQASGALAEEAEKLLDAANEVATVTEKVQRFDRALETTRALGPVDVAELLRDRVDTWRTERPGAAIDLDTPETLQVAGDAHLAEVIDELIENAMEHNEPPVAVDIRAERSDASPDDFVDLRIADNGPGIGDMERGVVSGETEITQLTHGSGLGLWFVHSVVEAYGGRIEFVDGEDDGTTVWIRLRRPGAVASTAIERNDPDDA
jgi:PAS domain S-box-containing protein